MNGLPSVEGPSSCTRTRSDADAASFMYSTSLVPARQLVVGADLEPDKLVRRLQRAGGVESLVGGGQARGRGEHEQPPQSIRNGPVANGH